MKRTSTMSSSTTVTITTFKLSPPTTTTSPDVLRDDTTQADLGETDSNRTSLAPHDADGGYDLRVLLCVVIGSACLVLALILGVCWWRRKKFRLRATFSVMYKRYFRCSIGHVVNWNGTFSRTADGGGANVATAGESDSAKRARRNDGASQAATQSLETSNLAITQAVENLGKHTCISCPCREVLLSPLKDIGPGTKGCPQSAQPLGSPTCVGYVSLYDLSLTQGLPRGDHPVSSPGPFVISLENPSDTTATCINEIDSVYYSQVNYHGNVNTLFHLDSQSPGIANSGIAHHNGDTQARNTFVQHTYTDKHGLVSKDPNSGVKSETSCRYCHQKHEPQDPTTVAKFCKDSCHYVNVKEIQLGRDVDAMKSKDLTVQFLNKAIPNGKVKLKSNAVFRGDYVNHISLNLDLTGPNGTTDTDV